VRCILSACPLLVLWYMAVRASKTSVPRYSSRNRAFSNSRPISVNIGRKMMCSRMARSTVTDDLSGMGMVAAYRVNAQTHVQIEVIPVASERGNEPARLTWSLSIGAPVLMSCRRLCLGCASVVHVVGDACPTEKKTRAFPPAYQYPRFCTSRWAFETTQWPATFS